MNNEKTSSLGVVFSHAENVVARNVAGEFILVPLVGHAVDLNSVFHLSRMGSHIWEQLDGKRSGREIVAGIVNGFEVSADRAAEDYLRFVFDLESVSLIVRSAGREV